MINQRSYNDDETTILKFHHHVVGCCVLVERQRGVLHKQIYIRQRMIMRESEKIESELKQVARLLLCWLQSIAAAAVANNKRMKSANCDEGS